MANLNSNALTQFHAQLTEEFNVPELQQFVQDMEDAEKMQKVFEASKHLHKLNNVEEFSSIFKKKKRKLNIRFRFFGWELLFRRV